MDWYCTSNHPSLFKKIAIADLWHLKTALQTVCLQKLFSLQTWHLETLIYNHCTEMPAEPWECWFILERAFHNLFTWSSPAQYGKWCENEYMVLIIYEGSLCFAECISIKCRKCVLSCPRAFVSLCQFVNVQAIDWLACHRHVKVIGTAGRK